VKVLHVIAGLPKAAGTSVFCVEACNSLSSLGVETAIAFQQAEPSAYLPNKDVSVFATQEGVEALGFNPDIVHIHALWNPFLHRANVWAQSLSLPVVYSPHGMLTPWALRAKWYKKMMALAIYQYWDLRQAKLFHATAESEVADIRRMGLKQPVFVVPLGVHLPTLKAIRVPRSTKMALFVSRVHPKKGLLNLVEAWAILKKRQSAIINWKCVIAGPDQDGHTAEVRTRAERLGVANDFEFVGAVYGEEKEALYACADLFVLPTYSENFGVVVVEALAFGCPVITTKAAPWKELENCGNAEASSLSDLAIIHTDNQTAQSNCAGWWIDVGVEPLAQALNEAMSLSDAERGSMGRAGRKLVERKYTWSAVAREMKQGYEELLSPK
jgi:glycosyltransferase involved in cell wall biosynthesis